MSFSILHNLSATGNHSTRLKELFVQSETVLIASPFLMTDFADFFSEVKMAATKSMHLITTLAPKSFDQIRKINSLISLIELPEIQNGKIGCQISLNNRLHGKIYIFKGTQEYIAAIITSANFTDSGLSYNHEWGIEITSQNEIETLEKTILNTIEIRNLHFSDLYKMQIETNAFLEKHPKKEERAIELSLVDTLPNSSSINTDSAINYWLKPVGVTNHPIPETRLYNELREPMHFSKLRPNGVKPGDILIVFAVGSTKIISLFRVTSYPEHATEEEIEDDDWLERWPWYVEAENLTLKFGATWARNGMFIGDIRDEYLHLHPNQDITFAGGQTFGAFNFGKDKLKLSPDFAHFMIEKIVSMEQNR